MIDFMAVYLIVWLSGFLHEMTHYCCAKVLSLGILRIKIGAEWLAFEKDKWSISPIVGGSYVEVSLDEVNGLEKKRMMVYFLGGIITNAVLAIALVSAYYAYGITLFLVGGIYNALLVLTNASPIPNSDVSSLVDIINRCEKER